MQLHVDRVSQQSCARKKAQQKLCPETPTKWIHRHCLPRVKLPIISHRQGCDHACPSRPPQCAKRLMLISREAEATLGSRPCPPDHIHCKASSAFSVCSNCPCSLRYVLVSGSFSPMRTRRPAAEQLPADELFRSRLENQIDLRHPLVQLSHRLPWSALEQALSPRLPATTGTGGRPALPVRLIAGLLYLKHAYDLSDEAVCERWLENPYWQFFSPARWCSRPACRAIPAP